MFKCGDYPILVHCVSDIVSDGLDVIGGIAHRDTYPCIFNDWNVVATVSERHALLTLHSDVFQNL